MVFLAVSDSSGVEFYSEKQDEIKKKFLRRYKALLSWINSNNVELKFLTVEEFQELRYDHSLNFSINMLILNKSFIDIIKHKQLKVILSSLKVTVFSLENHEPIISNGSPEICFKPSSIPHGFLETCSEILTLKYLQVENFEFPHILNLEETHFKNVIFNYMYFTARTDVCMPRCLEKFYMDIDFQVCNDQIVVINLGMNRCQYIKEL
jgi:hypothetical protein